MKILITGSNFFTDESVIEKAFDTWAPKDTPITLIEGECPGADLLCKKIALARGWKVEEYPPGAGANHNQTMVDQEPDVAIAFYNKGRTCWGTSDTVERAIKAGIPLHVYYQESYGSKYFPDMVEDEDDNF